MTAFTPRSAMTDPQPSGAVYHLDLVRGQWTVSTCPEGGQFVYVAAFEASDLQAALPIAEEHVRAREDALAARWAVDDLQACEPWALFPPPDGVTVDLDDDLDSMGFHRATVTGDSRQAVLDYVRQNWGDDDDTGGWYTEWVVDRVAQVRP